MALIVFTAICVLNGGFMLYVLVQWTRESRRKGASRRNDSQTRTHRKPYIVSSRKHSGKGGDLPFAADRRLADAEPGTTRSSANWERIVYQRIARSLALRKRVGAKYAFDRVTYPVIPASISRLLSPRNVRRSNMLVGIIAPFIGIKLIDMGLDPLLALVGIK